MFLFRAAEILSHASLTFPDRAELFDLKSTLKMFSRLGCMKYQKLTDLLTDYLLAE